MVDDSNVLVHTILVAAKCFHCGGISVASHPDIEGFDPGCPYCGGRITEKLAKLNINNVKERMLPNDDLKRQV